MQNGSSSNINNICVKKLIGAVYYIFEEKNENSFAFVVTQILANISVLAIKLR